MRGIVALFLLQSFGFAALAELTSDPSFFCVDEVLDQPKLQYIFLGEDHRDYDAFLFLRSHSDFFKKQGFQTYFVEYVESQRGPLSEDSSWEELLSDWGYSLDKYLRISYLLLNQDFAVYGLDQRRDLAYMHPGSLEKMAIRDQRMFSLVHHFVDRNPDQKLFFFNGSSHSHINPHLQAPSFYERFLEVIEPQQVMNLKIDHYAFDQVSPQRLRLHQISSGALGNFCPQGFFFFKDPESEDFDYYIYREGEHAFPVGDYRGPLI